MNSYQVLLKAKLVTVSVKVKYLVPENSMLIVKAIQKLRSAQKEYILYIF